MIELTKDHVTEFSERDAEGIPGKTYHWRYMMREPLTQAQQKEFCDCMGAYAKHVIHRVKHDLPNAKAPAVLYSYVVPDKDYMYNEGFEWFKHRMDSLAKELLDLLEKGFRPWGRIL